MSQGQGQVKPISLVDRREDLDIVRKVLEWDVVNDSPTIFDFRVEIVHTARLAARQCQITSIDHLLEDIIEVARFMPHNRPIDSSTISRGVSIGDSHAVWINLVAFGGVAIVVRYLGKYTNTPSIHWRLDGEHRKSVSCLV